MKLTSKQKVGLVLCLFFLWAISLGVLVLEPRNIAGYGLYIVLTLALIITRYRFRDSF